MPELAEVESARRAVSQALLGQKIVAVASVQDEIVFEGVSSSTIQRTLRNRTMTGSGRRGKHFWIEFDKGPQVVFHLGMTGAWHFYRERKSRPKFWKIELQAADGTRCAMTNVRRLGRIRLRYDPEHELPISNLGFDPLLDLPTPAKFRALVSPRKCPIKALLLDQKFAAGVGNWIADEVLYQARIAPARRANQLDEQEVDRIRSCLGRIVRHAVKVSADATRFPKSWLFHHRWGKNPAAVTQQGHPLRFDTIGGRTTAWVPEVQR